MHRPVYQVCDNTSCSIKIRVIWRTPLLQLAAEFRLGSGLLTVQVPHRVRQLTSYAQATQKNARKLDGSKHVTVCLLCFLTWQASLSSLICQMRMPMNTVDMHAELQGMSVA